MAETALNFGPDWLRALAHGPSTSQPATSQSTPPNTTIPKKYRLAQFRYGREEMLALIPKDPKKPDCLLRDTSKVVRETFAMPLALTPTTEDEQRLWSRSVNSDAVLRASGKSVPGNMGRGGRGGSIDRGRGRGRGGYYQRGSIASYDQDSEDGPPGTFSRPKPIERSQSANEKDQRWDDRDRRFDRTYSGRGGGADDSVSKLEQSRSSHSQEYWRKHDKDDESDWRSSSIRSSDKTGARGSWRNPVEKERRDLERNPSTRGLNGNPRNSNSHQKPTGNHLPEWSVEEGNEQDVVGTFDSSGAFLESTVTNESSDDIYISDDADEGMTKDSPEANKDFSTQKTPQKSSSPPQANTSSKQNSVKQTNSLKKSNEQTVEKHPPKHSEPPSSGKTLTNVAANKSANHVIQSNNSVQHHNVNSQKQDMPNVPENAAKNAKGNSVISNQEKTAKEMPVPNNTTIEEDAFAHHQKATENMVAQWTEEEEQRVISQPTPPIVETDVKWFYQDPQGEIQGPFKSSEMLEWFSAGYFTMTLMVRRTYDEKFSQLGELIKSWGRVPFMPGNSPSPVRAPPMTSSHPTPPTQTVVPNPAAAPVASQLPKQGEHLMALQQQLLQQQLMQQQLMLRQAQLQQILSQLKQQENFTSLNTQQQQQVLMQQFMAQQQMPRPNLAGGPEQPNIVQPNIVDTMTPLQLPLLGLPMAPLLKNDLSLWNIPPSNAWPVNVAAPQPPAGSIWDVEMPNKNPDETDLEKQQHLAEEREKLRRAEEARQAQEREREELRRKQEEERLLLELKQQEEEKKRLEELKRKEEKRKQEELKRLEEQRQKEEELRKIEEEKRLEELKRQEEKKKLEELKRKEEERRQEELRKQKQKELEEKRKKEELQKKLEMEREQERLELERQKEAARLKEIEREQQLQRERQRQKEKEEEMKRLAEIRLKAQGPVWGIQNSQSDSQLSLADIQRLQEEKERQEREEKERLRLQQLQQQALKQAQQNKNGLSWAKSFYKSSEPDLTVKSLAEIQQEEAERLVLQQKIQKPQAPAPVVNTNVGVWGNSSHLNRITAAPPIWTMNSVASTGFWDDALSSSTQAKKQPAKSNDSAFPALSNHPEKPATATVQSNKSKNVRAKKEEDAIKKLFGNRKPTDEFTAWCTDALSAMPSSVDVPTFVAFLKDIESPYEVHDYVKSYLGDGKEPREFAKLFLEKRSKFRAKQTSIEDNSLWGPAPAITPVVNKTNPQPVNDNDGNSNSKGKTKRRKNRMQKLDNSMLGFTVQSNPDRLNVGEIEQIEM